MFGLSFGEVLVIAALGLIIFGPDELPRVAKTIMQLMNGLRKQSDEVRREFYNSVYKPAEDIRRELSQSLVIEPPPPAKPEESISPEHHAEQPADLKKDDHEPHG